MQRRLTKLLIQIAGIQEHKIEYFKKPFATSFLRIMGYVEKPLQRMKHLIIETLTFEMCCSNVVFLVKMINNMQNQN